MKFLTSAFKALINAYRPIRKINIIYEIAHLLIWIYSRVVLRMNVYKHTKLQKGAKIFAANHPSFTDPFLLHLHEKMNVLVTSEAFGNGLTNKLLHKVGEIPVAPGGDSLEKAIKRLKAGHSIGIFPEGVISPHEGGMARARSGAARLALSTGLSIIPVGIHINRKLLKPVKFRLNGQRLSSYIYLRGAYSVTVGEPMYFSGDPEDRVLVNKVTKIIAERIKELAYESELRMVNRVSPLQTIFQTIKRAFSFRLIGMV